MSSDSKIITQMMPHEIVQDSLCNARCSHVRHIPLLISPLHPASLGGAGVDQHHALHSLRVGQSVSGEHISPESHTNTNILDNLEMVEHLLDLFWQLLHAGILIICWQCCCSILLAWSIYMKYWEPWWNFLQNEQNFNIRLFSLRILFLFLLWNLDSWKMPDSLRCSWDPGHGRWQWQVWSWWSPG